MTPDETFFLKDETDIATDEWFDCLISVLIPSRALHLGRPVLASEFFGNSFYIVKNLVLIP